RWGGAVTKPCNGGAGPPSPNGGTVGRWVVKQLFDDRQQTESRQRAPSANDRTVKRPPSANGRTVAPARRRQTEPRWRAPSPNGERVKEDEGDSATRERRCEAVARRDRARVWQAVIRRGLSQRRGPAWCKGPAWVGGCHPG